MRTILQSEASECSLACLAMVLDHFGHEMTIGELRRRFVVSVNGVTLSTLIRLAEGLDLIARPIRLEIESLSELETPAILHWNMDHFVVLERWTRSGPVIIDPALGRRHVPIEEASRSFTGVALALTRAPSFESQAQPERATLQAIGLRLDTHVLKGMGYALLIAGAVEGAALLSPVYAQLVIDRAPVTGASHLLVTMLAGFSLLLVTRAVLAFVRDLMLLRLSVNLRFAWASGIFSKLVSLPADFFQKRHVGDILSRFQSVEAIQQTISHGAIVAMLDLIFIALALAIMLSYSAKLSAIVAAVAVLFCVFRWLTFQPLRRANQEQIMLSARENSYFLETLRAIIPLKLGNRIADRRAQWQNLFARVLRLNAKTQTLTIAFDAGETLLKGLPTLAVLFVGAAMLERQELSIGMLVAFCIYADILTIRLAALASTVTQFRLLGLHAQRVSDIALEPSEDTVPATPALSSARAQGARAGSIELADVSYRYGDSEPWILKSVTMKIEPGAMVVIAGPSGSGKSTLVKLILGLVKPTSGVVRYDNIPMESLGAEAFRDEVACVLQDDELLAGTIADNISFFSPTVDFDRVVQCATAAAVHADIAAMPLGYRTLVGDMGSSLSGGQRQRVLLARALYKAPQLLVLDEATSQLDPGTEASINEFLRKLGTTRVVIAHRVETQLLADEVHVLSKGTLTRSDRLPGSSGEGVRRHRREHIAGHP